ncbi:MAG: PEGA domain-containing protein [Acidobacteria bacterium]|nr:PEGA domain-containing protein [Acidobacteriota bacterium]
MRNLLLLLWALPLASCATMLAPKVKYEEIAVRSTPDGADASILCEGKQTGSGATPTKIVIPRSAGDCVLHVKKDGFAEETVNVEGGVNPTYWSNMVFTPFIPAAAYGLTSSKREDKAWGAAALGVGVAGLFTDFWTGAVHAHRNNDIQVALKPVP